MSEHLTHIAIFEDTYQLVQHTRTLHPAFKSSLEKYPDIGLLASSSRGNHLFAIPFLEAARQKWGQHQAGDGTEEQVAAAIGWLSHRAIDRQVKPIHLKDHQVQDARFSEIENEIYHDAVTFDKVFERGDMPSVSPWVELSEATLSRRMQGHPASEWVHTAQTEQLVTSLVQQNLLQLRTFNQTASTPAEWLEQFADNYQKLGEDLDTYIEAFTYPDPAKMEKYIFSLNVYNEEDDLIRLVRQLKREGHTDIGLQSALDKAAGQSHYAQGLRNSLRFIQAGSDFFEGKIEKSACYDRVQIFHAPHRK